MAPWALVSAGFITRPGSVMCFSSRGPAPRCQMVSCTELVQLRRSWPSRGSGLVCICRHRNLFVSLGLDCALYLQDIPKLEAGRTRGFWGTGEDIAITQDRPDPRVSPV